MFTETNCPAELFVPNLKIMQAHYLACGRILDSLPVDSPKWDILDGMLCDMTNDIEDMADSIGLPYTWKRNIR